MRQLISENDRVLFKQIYNETFDPRKRRHQRLMDKLRRGKLNRSTRRKLERVEGGKEKSPPPELGRKKVPFRNHLGRQRGCPGY